MQGLYVKQNRRIFLIFTCDFLFHKKMNVLITMDFTCRSNTLIYTISMDGLHAHAFKSAYQGAIECMEKVFKNWVVFTSEMHPTIDPELFVRLTKLLMYVRMLLHEKCEVVHCYISRNCVAESSYFSNLLLSGDNYIIQLGEMIVFMVIPRMKNIFTCWILRLHELCEL